MKAARTRLMEQLTLIVMGATGTTIMLEIVEIMMTTILCQMKFVVHVEVFCQPQDFNRIEANSVMGANFQINAT